MSGRGAPLILSQSKDETGEEWRVGILRDPGGVLT